jgi:hypothetical protein
MYTNSGLPLEGIVMINESDIICGRGGLSLKHPGNAAYRKIVSLNKEIYATCPKTEKLRISKSIVAAVRDINARFLEREDGKVSHSLDEKDEDGNPVTWRDIGNKRAIEKTSQALREGQPKLLKKLTDGNVQVNHGGAAPHQFSLSDPPQQGVLGNFNHMLGDVQMLGNLHHHFQSSLPLGRAQTISTPSSLPLVLSQSGNAQPLQEVIVSFGEIDIPTKNDSPNITKSEKWFHSSNTTTETDDSWGGSDQVPLPFDKPATHAFSIDDHTQLMRCLSVCEDGHGTFDADCAPKRSSVRFRLDDFKSKSQMSLMSGISRVSELSIPSGLSLDSAMDAAERESELENIGEFRFSDYGDMSCGTPNDSSGRYSSGQCTTITRRSILKRGSYAMNLTANSHADPGLIFTSTLDSKPNGINAGTDVSCLLGNSRNSDGHFTRSSICSALTDFSMMYKRDVGSTRSMGSMLSIRSADFRELLAEFADDSDGDDSMGLKQG